MYLECYEFFPNSKNWKFTQYVYILYICIYLWICAFLVHVVSVVSKFRTNLSANLQVNQDFCVKTFACRLLYSVFFELQTDEPKAHTCETDVCLIVCLRRVLNLRTIFLKSTWRYYNINKIKDDYSVFKESTLSWLC